MKCGAVEFAGWWMRLRLLVVFGGLLLRGAFGSDSTVQRFSFHGSGISQQFHSEADRQRAKPQGTPEKELRKVEYARALSPICKNPNVQCDEVTSSRYRFFAGTFGIGVPALLRNDGSNGLVIYRNCPVAYHTDPLSDTPVCESKHIMSQTDAPEIRVFIKTLQWKSCNRQEVRYAFNNRVTAFQKESRRARVLARAGLGTSGYDLYNSTTQSYISRAGGVTPFYVQQLVVGMPGSKLLDSWQKATALTFLRLGEKMVNLMAEHRAAEEEDKAEILDSIEDMGLLLEKEFFTKYRWGLLMLDTFLYFSARMFGKDLRHCDLHYENFFVMKSPIDSLDELHRGGKAAEFMPERALDKRLITRRDFDEDNDEEVSLFGYQFNPSAVRLIDPAYIINLGEAIKRGGGAHLVQTPCRYYRPSRDSDMGHLFVGLERISTKLLTQMTPRINSIKRLAKDVGLEGFDAATEDPVFLEFWRRTTEITNMLHNLWPRALEFAPEAFRCYKNTKTFWALGQSKEVSYWDMRSGHPKLAEFSCTVQNELDGMQKSRDFLYMIGEDLKPFMDSGHALPLRNGTYLKAPPPLQYPTLLK